MSIFSFKTLALLAAFECFATTALTAAPPADYEQAATAAKNTLGELIAADTTSPPGNEARAVAIVASRLKNAGVPYEITEFAPGRQNIVARLAGTGELKPLLLIAHLDVVGADPKAWSSDPHKLTEKDGYLVGRGVYDDLGMAVAELEVFLLLKERGTKLKRDVILALTGDEESDGAGVRYLLKNKPASIQASSAINEGGNLVLNPQGTVKAVEYQLAEKVYLDFELTARGPGGHSSVPLKGNAIYRLATALARLAKVEDPARLLPSTRAYFAAAASTQGLKMAEAMKTLSRAGKTLPAGALKVVEENPTFGSTLRTTCVATMISGGIRVNALPAEAKANINCRMLPDESVEERQKKLAHILGDPGIEIKLLTDVAVAPPSPVAGEVPRAISSVAGKRWPNAPVIPFLSQGASDSIYLRAAGIDSYGLHPFPMTQADSMRAHGADEREPVASVRTGIEFLHELILELAAPGSAP